jgi:hypothetical protein
MWSNRYLLTATSAIELRLAITAPASRSEALKGAAHEIRFASNDAVQGDILAESMSVAEAKEIVEPMDSILIRISRARGGRTYRCQLYGTERRAVPT